MSEHGATLQTYNQELVKCLEDLKVKKNTLQSNIDKAEGEKHVLEKSIKSLQEKLNIINCHINQHKMLRDSYEKIIKETENGFRKILESSQTLLNLAQHETHKLESDLVKTIELKRSISEKI